jgi:hypothetical protein
MDLLMLGLRIAHIGGAVAWAGGALLFLGYVAPAAAALGPRGDPVLQELLRPHRLPRYFAIVSTVTVVAGAALYWRDTGGLQPSVVGSKFGLVFGIGGLAGLLAWIGAVFLIPRAIARIGALRAELQAIAPRPSPDLETELLAAQQGMRRIGIALLVLLTIAVVLMSVGRYV